MDSGIVNIQSILEFVPDTAPGRRMVGDRKGCGLQRPV